MKNKFFQFALKQASTLLTKRSRLFLLLAQLASKLKQVNWRKVNVPAVKEKFMILGRITKAYALGRYREVPWKTMLTIVAGIVYFISPIDLIPDFIPITGLTDDVGVLLWIFNSVSKEVEKFLNWEKSESVSL
jgi:uncharacterized membrane protein YkvA (DUF1232 family)